jgi:hypothetical protein
MDKVILTLRTGEGKRTWYAYSVEYGTFSSDLNFIDKIHYDYLKKLQADETDKLGEE